MPRHSATGMASTFDNPAGHGSRGLRSLCCLLLAGCAKEAASVSVAELHPDPGPEAAVQHRSSVRAVSFNIRASIRPDGDNRWRQRREIAIETIRDLAADFVGLQEACSDQRKGLQSDLEEFLEVDGAADRDDYNNLNPILMRHGRFDVVRQGLFWLSETPEKLLSVGWGDRIPRACTWAVVRERTTTRELVVFNAHFASGVPLARRESALLIIERLRQFRDLPLIVLGDLNARSDAAELQALFHAELVDCFDAMHPGAADTRTYHAFSGDAKGLHRIDFVLCNRRWTVRGAGIERHARDGRYPSDHFPVWADLGW